jgi:hypothetical protein
MGEEGQSKTLLDMIREIPFIFFCGIMAEGLEPSC